MYKEMNKHKQNDILIFIDKTNRWEMVFDSVKNKDKYTKGKGTYVLQEESGLLNIKGKALYLFSENNPQPLKLKYNKAEWLDAKSLMATINNELIQMMVNPTNPSKDMIMMLGAIGGIVAGFASIVILVLQTGVI
jgi:LPS O-antigen subunit length determinant protein (WzzB/FepE family)